jgi:hypothetical protein
MDLAFCCKLLQRPLHRAGAGSEYYRQGRARPGFTIGKEREQRPMRLLDRRRQYHDLTGLAQHQRKTPVRRFHLHQVSKLRSKTSDFHPKPRAMRFIGMPGPEGAGKERRPWSIPGPGFT